MGWVVDGAVIRFRGELGEYRRREWRALLRDCGLTWSFEPLPEPIDAVTSLTHGHVMFRNGLSEDDIVHAAFHEAWHALANAGDVRWWTTCPQGNITVDKWESRAEQFASAFPVD